MTGHKCSVFRFSEIEVHERELQLRRAGQAFPVEPKAFRVLIYLLRNPGRLIRKDELLNAGWGDTAVTENSLTRNIAVLRRLLDDETRAPRYIETVSTVGYRFICPVEEVEDEAVRSEVVVGTKNGQIPASRPKDVAITSAATKARWKPWIWALSAAGLAILAIRYGYLRQPLAPPHITDYTAITLDGRHKILVGTDGNRLYVNVLDPPLETAQVPISGGQLSPIRFELPIGGQYAFRPEIEDVSPDGSGLLVIEPHDANGVGNIWVVGTQGYPARYLTRGSHAAWSPDGKSVVYSGAFGDFHVIPSGGGESRFLIKLSQISTGPLSIATPHWLETGRPYWSPDGRVIRFSWNQQIWEVSPNGANLHQLFTNWRASSFKCCGRWTPDGKFYIFRSGNSLSDGNFDPGAQLFALDERRGPWRPSGSAPIQLTSPPIVWGNPVPSHDGKKIFARGQNLRGELLRWNSDAKQLQPYLGGISAEYLSFSRDGNSVAYVSYPDGILWRANRDGSGQVQLTKSPMYPKVPRWSPDGTQIIFEDDSPTGVYRMYVISVQGGTPVRVLPEDNDSQSDPNWSPDGKSLVYAYAPGHGSGPLQNRAIRILDVPSHRVTTVPGSEGYWSPRWSPDGRYLAALTSLAGIAVFDLETHHWTTIQEKETGFPTFSHDSRWIYFLRFYNAGVFRVPVSGGPAEQVIDLKDFRLGGFWGFWMGLDPTDAPLLLRDEGTDEIYALTLDRK